MLDQGALAAAGVAQQRQILAGGDLQRHIVQGDFFKRSSLTVHMPQGLQTDIRHNNDPLCFNKERRDGVRGVFRGERGERQVLAAPAEFPERLRGGGHVQP